MAEPKDVQMSSFTWIPTTPVKPNSTTIFGNWQPNDPSPIVDNWQASNFKRWKQSQLAKPPVHGDIFQNLIPMKDQMVIDLDQETIGAGSDIETVLIGVSSNLNSSSRTSTDADFCNPSSFQFKPITPHKNNKGKYVQKSPTGKDAKKNNIKGDKVTQLRGNKEKNNQSTEDDDFIKTPQQRAKRRKHRPRVIIESQKKSISKSRAKTPSVPQETAKVKRKHVRSKGATNGIGLNNKEVSSTYDPTCERKYTKEGGNKTVIDLDKETTIATEVAAPQRTRRSCRKSLNFNSDYQVGDKSSSCSMNQLQENSPSSKDPLKDNIKLVGNQTLHTRGKCQMVFTNVTHDKETSSVQVRMNPGNQRRPKSLDCPICSWACLPPKRQVSGLKRQNRNNSSPGFYFPTIYKKQRTEKGHDMVASSSQQTGATPENQVRHDIHSLRGSFTSQIESVKNQEFDSGQCQVTDLPRTNPEIDGTQNERKIFENLLALGPTEKIRIRKSKGLTELRDLPSKLKVCGRLPASTSKVVTRSCLRPNISVLHEPPTCMEALAANTNAPRATKKRSKRSVLKNSAVPNLFNHQKSGITSKGPPLTLALTYMPPVNSIVEQHNQLDLEQHALVPYQRSGVVVPFDGSFDKVRRRIPRPIVDLNEETIRVWSLLLENINSEGIDGTNEEKKKWWEDERKVFNGRASSFIARMHLVQGDRRFSPWKGSVLDSVVGVFLTQNVSDHFSSSAFMSMAARFPLKSKTQPADLHEEVSGFNCGLDPDETFRLINNILNQSVCGENTKMSWNFEGDRIRKGKSISTSGSSSDGCILKEMLACQSPTTSKNSHVMSHETAAKKSVSLINDGREAEDKLSSRTPEISSQNSSDYSIGQTTERGGSCLPSSSEEEPEASADTNRFHNCTSFDKLLNIDGTVLHGVYKSSGKTSSDENRQIQSERLVLDLPNEGHLDSPTLSAETITPSSKSTLRHLPNSGLQETMPDLSKQDSKCFNSSIYKEPCSLDISELSSESVCGTTFQKITDVNFEGEPKSSGTKITSTNSDQGGEFKQKGQVPASSAFQDYHKIQDVSKGPIYQQKMMDIKDSNSNMNTFKNPERRVNSSEKGPGNYRDTTTHDPIGKAGKSWKEKEKQNDWDHMRKQTLIDGRERSKTANTKDSVDWEAVRCASVNEIAQTIKGRGMNNRLAERIKKFLNRIVKDHGSIDLEWLRDVPPEKAKEYLLSIRGLGLKSVECVRLLTLHHLAFPVDTNVCRIAVRLGWVPLQPLPESLQLHLLELYPVLESIQKYLWPRLCKLDQKTLYELHYQMITFGKVFCTKVKPNCNGCPMRGECRHFASAFASARLALPAPEEKGIIGATRYRKVNPIPLRKNNTLQLLLPSPKVNQLIGKYEVSNSQPLIEEPPSPEPIYEVPATPEQVYAEVSQCDIESAFDEDPDEIPTIKLNMGEFAHNLQKIMQQNTELYEDDMSKALVALTPEAASIPVPKLKNVNRLRTEHQVYELPDSHYLLEGIDKRDPDDHCPYLLAIWVPGETANSIESPERLCNSHELEKLCTNETCSSCNSMRETDSQTVRGTLLIPCRTAMRGSFPLNGTYFQVNEVFADHESSMSPINVPRQWLWNLRRRTVYFGTSVSTIFRGMTTEGIQYCFWRGFVCVRGFDRKTRAPRPLIARLHCPASRLAKGKGKVDEY